MVNNTSGFRYVMQQLYDYLQVKKSDGSVLQFRTTSAVQAEMVEIQGMLNAQKQIARYRRTVLKTFAPKMNKWFSLISCAHTMVRSQIAILTLVRGMVYDWTYRRTRRSARRKHIARYDTGECVHVDLIAFLIKD